MDQKEIGARLRQLRRLRQLSLRGVSRSTGISFSFLSGIEQGRHNVSVAKLKAILDTLGMNLSTFFSQHVLPAKIVYRENELIELAGHGKGVSYREVAAGRKGRTLQVVVERYKRGADTGPEMYRHGNEEAGVVLKGKLELTVESDVYTLGPGDAFYFDSSRAHRFRNVGRGEVKAISVNSPPSF
jgi:transcriptional regulator with XRE-family HTH domain